jgi:hypothetical protein
MQSPLLINPLAVNQNEIGEFMNMRAAHLFRGEGPSISSPLRQQLSRMSKKQSRIMCKGGMTQFLIFIAASFFEDCWWWTSSSC